MVTEICKHPMVNWFGTGPTRTCTTISFSWVRPEWELRLEYGYVNPDLLPAVSPDISKIL